MDKFKNYILMGAAFAFLVAVVSSVTAGPAIAQAVKAALVKNVNDALQPVQAKFSCKTPSGTIGCSTPFYTVPAGKRLVIEYVSMNACALPGITAYVTIDTSAGGVNAQHSLDGTQPAAAPGSGAIGCNSPAASSLIASGRQVRIYADPATFVTLEGNRNTSSGETDFDFTFSGYLVDVP